MKADSKYTPVLLQLIIFYYPGAYAKNADDVWQVVPSPTSSQGCQQPILDPL